jgi:lipopolysaccharide export system protein LptC
MTCCARVSRDRGRSVTVAPITSRGTHGPRRPPLPSRRIRRPAMLSAGNLARRRWAVGLAKRLLPLAALALLASVALWPELQREADHARMSYRRGSAAPESGKMVDASYHGVDTDNRPYTMTAATAHQVNPDRIDLVEPKGDMTLESGNWLMAQSHRGVYLPHTGSLDMSDAVHLYRDDGTTLDTSSATLDLKAGAAAGAEQVHSEGPFGTLDAQGFAVTDRGTVMQFTGPGRLLLTSAKGHPSPDAGPAIGPRVGPPIGSTIAPAAP